MLGDFRSQVTPLFVRGPRLRFQNEFAPRAKREEDAFEEPGREEEEETLLKKRAVIDRDKYIKYYLAHKFITSLIGLYLHFK